MWSFLFPASKSWSLSSSFLKKDNRVHNTNPDPSPVYCGHLHSKPLWPCVAYEKNNNCCVQGSREQLQLQFFLSFCLSYLFEIHKFVLFPFAWRWKETDMRSQMRKNESRTCGSTISSWKKSSKSWFVFLTLGCEKNNLLLKSVIFVESYVSTYSTYIYIIYSEHSLITSGQVKTGKPLLTLFCWHCVPSAFLSAWTNQTIFFSKLRTDTH